MKKLLIISIVIISLIVAIQWTLSLQLRKTTSEKVCKVATLALDASVDWLLEADWIKCQFPCSMPDDTTFAWKGRSIPIASTDDFYEKMREVTYDHLFEHQMLDWNRLDSAYRQELVKYGVEGKPVLVLKDGSGKSLRGECEDSVYSFLKGTGADIICLQEYYADDVETLRSRLSSRFNGYDFDFYVYTGRSGCFGNVILSRFPILGQGVIKFEHSSNLALYTDIRAYGREFRLYNCHFESYNISFPGIVKGLIGRKDGILKETERKMRHSLSLRPRQVDKVLEHISGCRSGTILCGDFNDNPMSYTYQRLIRGHRDTFCEAGKGFGATYSVLWPVLRIDYVFIPKEFRALTHASPRMGLSDHYPVISEIDVMQEGGDGKEKGQNR